MPKIIFPCRLLAESYENSLWKRGGSILHLLSVRLVDDGFKRFVMAYGSPQMGQSHIAALPLAYPVFRMGIQSVQWIRIRNPDPGGQK